MYWIKLILKWHEYGENKYNNMIVIITNISQAIILILFVI